MHSCRKWVALSILLMLRLKKSCEKIYFASEKLMHRDVCFVARRAHSARTAQSSTQVDSKRPAEAWHTVAIWTFTFHKIFGFERVILKVKFNPISQAKTINFFIRKIRFIKLIFLLFFAEFVKSSAFYTLLLLFQRVDMFELQFDAKITI